MAKLIEIQKMDGYVCCIAHYFTYTPENLHAFYRDVLTVCLSTDRDLVLVNFTAIMYETPATLKALAGLIAEPLLQKFQDYYNRVLRIAVLGTSPHITTYKPAQMLLQGAGHQVAMFTKEAEAWEWLFQDVPKTTFLRDCSH